MFFQYCAELPIWPKIGNPYQKCVSRLICLLICGKTASGTAKSSSSSFLLSCYSCQSMNPPENLMLLHLELAGIKDSLIVNGTYNTYFMWNKSTNIHFSCKLYIMNVKNSGELPFWYPQIHKVRSHYHLFFKICTFLTYLSNETKASQENSNFQSKGKALKLQLTNRPTLPWQHTILSIFPLEELQPKMFHATTHTNFTSLLALPRWRQLHWWGIPCQN